jgi:ATP-dependent Lon protease
MNFPDHNIPVVPTGEFVAFPGTTFTLLIKRGRTNAAVKRAQGDDRWLVCVAHKEEGTRDVGSAALARVGVLAKIEEARPTKGATHLVLTAHERFQIVDIHDAESFIVASGNPLADRTDTDERTLNSLRDSLQTLAEETLELIPTDTSSLVAALKQSLDPGQLSYQVAQYMSLTRAEAQDLLETTSLKNRLLRVLELLVVRKEGLKVQSKIRETLSESLSKKQREVLLREQLKAIQDELGEGGEGPSAEDYRERIAKAEMPEEARKVALREASRLERMGDQSAESHVIRNYLDLLCEMPWKIGETTAIDLNNAEETLNRDHYGLKEIKKRILEHLAVMKLRPEKRGSILLFVGPPGVGKTSLGKSIAESLGRAFVRVSLGGVRDDADIRGHRRTYVGALPGRIIDGIRRSKAKDPVFVLDEIDKVSRGWGGDPSSALLEVLDPEQNFNFHDHYLDVAFDLSQIFFIGTANTKETIPPPLLDRMEIIEMSGYTTDEKFHIARDHLFPRELEEHGLSHTQVELTDDALMRIIETYTREAGVRSLKRELSRITRYSASRVARHAGERVAIHPQDLHAILGPPRFEYEELSAERIPGVVTGLAWTPVGGEILFVEAASIPGDGKVFVTGKLGDVMKESSQIAVALARSRLENLAKAVIYKDRDIHIHVPGGAVPKDGPSAGVTMFTAVASMMLGIPVDPKIAMTGEITLQGKCLPVGGIKEKILAAIRSGVEELLIPARNERDLEAIPPDILQSITVRFVSNVDDVMRHIFGELGAPLIRRPEAERLHATLSPPDPHLHRGGPAAL